MRSARTKVAVILPLLAGMTLLATYGAYSSTIAQPQGGDPAFEEVWTRTDGLVLAARVQRSFYWGWSVASPMYERFDEGPGGRHLVHYFEKSRMEINNPNANRSNPFYVTNGQLAKELITGRVQVGTNNFVQLPPANVAVANDTPDGGPGAPTYASFGGVIRNNPRQVGEPVNTTINRAWQEGTDRSFSDQYGVRYAYYEPATQNNIPDVFWDFLNVTGPVVINGRETTARLNDPYFYATGYPISAAYWARGAIAGKPDTAVLIQPYERRVLTYVPSAPEGWRVQMGNVGIHYFEWRYNRRVDFRGSVCQEPDGVTGKLWFARPEVQHWLGCIDYFVPEQGVTVAHQQFERGQMLDLIRPTGLKTIYVLFEDGTAQMHHDAFVDGSAEPPLTPPAGRYAPRGGFGKVWREANLQQRLGWATAPETVVNYDPSTEPPVPTPVPTALPGMPTPAPPPPPPTAVPASARGFAAVRNFGGNLIVYTGPGMRKLYVIHVIGTRWAVYDPVQ